MSGSSLEQFRRYVTEHLLWCQRERIDVPVTDEQRHRYREHLEETTGLRSERAWSLRCVYLNKLPRLVAEHQRLQGLKVKRRRTRLIDALPEGAPLSVAIDRILAEVKPSYRRSLRCDIALVLEWCEAEDLEPTAIGTSELTRLRRWLRENGRRSDGPLVAARRLHTAFYVPEVWWR